MFFKTSLFLIGKHSYRERGNRLIFHLLGHFPNAWKRQVWVRSKPEVTLIGGQDPVLAEREKQGERKRNLQLFNLILFLSLPLNYIDLVFDLEEVANPQLWTG